MNKRLIRILEPGFRLLFATLAAFAAISFFVNLYLFIAELAVVILLLIYYTITNKRRRREIIRYMESIGTNVEVATKDSIVNFPLPMVIIKFGTGEIIWSNDYFLDIIGEGGSLFETKITEVVPGFDWHWVAEGKTVFPGEVAVKDRKYEVYGSVVHMADNAGRSGMLATFYWVDVTEFSTVREKYANTRPVVFIIALDNYEEIMKNLTDLDKSSIIAAVDNKISEWIKPYAGILRKFDRDKYLFICEEQNVASMVAEEFTILDQVREITNPDKIPVTFSIGIGKDGQTFEENYKQAALALDMAFSRGGDQVVIRNRLTFSFFGGRSKEIEKRTKVKSRIMANTLGELISTSSKVLIMGHRVSDIDSLGAACGIVCAARKKNKQASIVVNLNETLAETLVERLLEHPEYQNIFITEQEAMLSADSGTLLVVVDTNRPDIVESRELLDSVNHVAVIDHHRRASSYIENAVFNYHEPYASSSCEMVTELLQYLVEPTDILRCEAEAILGGIVLDTKCFTLRTGVRTFEAAAFLRRAGADTVEIKKLFQVDLDSSIERYEIIRKAKLHAGVTAIAVVSEQVNRTIASQAVDEMLNISGVGASFVLFPQGDSINISARSYGKVNVQVILEKLGGGGHHTMAGAQVQNKTADEVLEQLKSAIDDYLKRNPVK